MHQTENQQVKTHKCDDMLGHKLLSIMRVLTKIDYPNCRKYIASPYFNDAPDTVRLYDYILKTFRKRDAQQQLGLRKEATWAYLYPKKDYHDGLMRQLSSELTQLVHGFLSQQQLEENPTAAARLLLPKLARPELEKHFNGVMRQARNTLTQQGHQDAHYHLQSFHLHQTQHRYSELTDSRSNDLEDLYAAARNLACYYHMQQLYHHCEAVSHYIFLHAEQKLPLPDILQPEFQDPYGVKDEPVVQAFVLASAMLQDDEAAFTSLRALMQAHEGKFGQDTLKSLYLYVKNFCIHLKINNGDKSYFSQLFDIYRDEFSRGLLTDNNRLDPQHYKNITTLGLHNGQYDWTEKFINENTKMLPEGNQDNAQSYNLAKLYFHKLDYPRVIELLRTVEYEDITYALGARLMLLKTYYELGEFKPLDSLLESFGVYVRRNRTISADVQQQYLNVLRFTRRLSNLPPGDRAALQKLKTQLIDCKAVAAKDWLLSKME